MSELTLEITGCGSEMQGVGRLPDGRAAFVPGAIPGETVRAEIAREKDRFALLRLKEVLAPSPDRRAPFCPHYGACGGCQAQHISYERALKLKRARVFDSLARLGGQKNPLVLETLPSPLTRGYRNKAEFALRGAAGGVYEAGSKTLVDIDACPLQADEANRAFAFVKPFARECGIQTVVTRVNGAGDALLALSTAGNAAPGGLRALARRAMADLPHTAGVCECRLHPRPAHALDGEIRLLAGEKTLSDALCGLTFQLSPQSFFQVNRPQAERLYEEALSMAALSPGDEALDVYCGAGAISLCAARRCARVTGIEIVPEAVRDAAMNALKNGLSEKTAFLAGDAGQLYARVHRERHPDAVILDPPRKGLSGEIIKALLQAPAPRVVYVSCDPGTLARDVKQLTETGAYALVKARPVDMFPQTAHVETVVQLVLRNPVTHINIDVDVEELVQDKRGQATYPQIKEYVLEHTGLKVSSLYIAQVKQKHGIIERDNYNKPKSEDSAQPKCPPDKEKAITDALKHFGMLPDKNS